MTPRTHPHPILLVIAVSALIYAGVCYLIVHIA